MGLRVSANGYIPIVDDNELENNESIRIHGHQLQAINTTVTIIDDEGIFQ